MPKENKLHNRKWFIFLCWNPDAERERERGERERERERDCLCAPYAGLFTGRRNSPDTKDGDGAFLNFEYLNKSYVTVTRTVIIRLPSQTVNSFFILFSL
jgi:hypothetical protein